jgi:CubicO group peptidase (beta-lactamase class C family)
MNLLPVLLGIMGAARPDSTPPLRTDPVEKVVADLRDFVPPIMARDRIPGMAIALIRDGRIAWSGGFGIASTLSRGPVTQRTAFPVASLGKPAAAHAALRLVSRGELALDQPLARYLPTRWLGDDSPITLRHVLAHTSGLSNFLGERSPRPRFESGTRFDYSGVGFMYLQHVLQVRGGGPLDSVVARETFRPLGIERAWYGDAAGADDDVAYGHMTLGRAVMPFGLVFFPLVGLGLLLGAAVRRALSGRWRPTKGIRLGAVLLAAAGGTAFLYAKAANPRLVPYFVLVFAFVALLCLIAGEVVGGGRRRMLRIPATVAAALAIFWFARTVRLPVPHGASPEGSAASSLRAGAADLALLAVELGRPTLLDSTVGRELLADQSKAAEHIAWGLGVAIQRAPGADAVFHWGRSPAARSAMVYYPATGTGIVVLANEGDATKAVREVALLAIGGPSYWAEE